MKFISFILFVHLAAIAYFYYSKGSDLYARPHITSLQQIVDLFPKTPQDLKKLAESAMSEALMRLKPIYELKKEDRTFENTMRALDVTLEDFNIIAASIYVLSLVSPYDDLRTAAHEASTELQAFAIDTFNLNKRLYQACAEFADLLHTNKDKESQLTDEERYFVSETIKDFERSGLALDSTHFEKVRAINKDLGQLRLDFERNILQANKMVELSSSELEGVDQNFVNSFEKGKDGKLKVQVNIGTLQRILFECTVTETRKKLYQEYMQTAYPENEKLINKIVALSNELAHVLSYKSFAYLDIENQMAHNPETVLNFLNDLVKRARIKTKKEVDMLKKDLPDEFSLTSDGKFYPWDLSRIKYLYKKQYLDIDEMALADYFPFDHTLPALFSVYEKFFGLTFKRSDASHTKFWHEEVQVWSIYRNGVYHGTVLLDLFPRPNKYTHAGEVCVVPAVKSGNVRYPAVVVVVANFARASQGKPVLLKKMDVITFFHEFGHAIHDLLSSTELTSFAGARTKGDFIEMPSQMLEEWMYDPEILKMISSHYQTKKPLSDEQIAKIRNLKHSFSGDEILKQIYYAFYCLELFLPGKKDAQSLWQSLHEKLITHYTFDPKNHGYCTFTQIGGYGSKYYGYLWSKVFALDLFHTIKPHGLLNPAMGKKYADAVISKGGSTDPEMLIESFLGRKPNQDAFFKDLGL